MRSAAASSVAIPGATPGAPPPSHLRRAQAIRDVAPTRAGRDAGPSRAGASGSRGRGGCAPGGGGGSAAELPGGKCVVTPIPLLDAAAAAATTAAAGAAAGAPWPLRPRRLRQAFPLGECVAVCCAAAA